MALVALPLLQHNDAFTISGLSVGGITLDADGERIGVVTQAPKSGVINSIHFRLAGVVSGGTPSMVCSIQGVDASGDPTGTDYGGSTSGSVALDAAGVYTATLTTGATVTGGDVIAVVLVQSGAGSFSFARQYSTTNGESFPYTVSDLSVGTWAKSNSGWYPYVIGYDDGSFALVPRLASTASNIGTFTYNSGSASFQEYGLAFTPAHTMKLDGISYWGTVNAGQNVIVTLYSGFSSTSTMTTLTVDGGVIRGPTAASRRRLLFAEPQILTKGTDYVIGIRAGGTTNVTLSYFDHPSVAQMAASWMGTEYQVAKRDTASATWDITDTQQPFLIPSFIEIDDGTIPPGNPFVIQPSGDGGGIVIS